MRLAQFDARRCAQQVIETEKRVNELEVEIDRELSSIIARRQPTARDLRLLMAISKTTANLERVGDEASKIARMVKSHHRQAASARALPFAGVRVAADLASGMLRKALDAFARLDARPRLSILQGRRRDRQRVRRLRAQADHLHDGRPAHHLRSLDLLFLAKAIERIGDHAKNIAEFIIYIVKGADVRHTSMEEIESRRARAEAHEEQPRVLIVEDEPSIAELIAVNLRHNGFTGAAAEDGEAAQREIDTRAARPDPARLDAARPERPRLLASLARRTRAPRPCRSSC